MNIKSFHATYQALIFLTVSLASSTSYANTILDFEGPLPDGLVAQSFAQDTFVSDSQKVSNHYLNQGVIISDAAIVALGVGHAASGSNGLAGVSSSNQIDYDIPVNFSFYLPSDISSKALTNYFAYAPDLAGGSGNIVTISGYDISGNLMGQSSYTETGTFNSLLTLSGIGLFHSVTIDQTLFNRYSGGIGIDLVQYGDLLAAPVPEPETYAMLILGLGIMGFVVRRRKGQ
jgi:hypothetical protein